MANWIWSWWQSKQADEAGAVTVDWVVIMAGIVVLGTVIVTGISGGMEQVASDIDAELSAVSVS